MHKLLFRQVFPLMLVLFLLIASCLLIQAHSSQLLVRQLHWRVATMLILPILLLGLHWQLEQMYH